MPAVLQVHPHLTADELLQRFQCCREVEERERLHCVLLMLRSRSTTEIAGLFLKRVDWVRRTVRRYNEGGPDAMKDGRAQNGRPRMLTTADEEALRAALLAPPRDGGLWSGPKVAAWIAARRGVPVSNHVGWSSLRRLGYTAQRPGRAQSEADKGAQEALKKRGLADRCCCPFRRCRRGVGGG